METKILICDKNGEDIVIIPNTTKWINNLAKTGIIPRKEELIYISDLDVIADENTFVYKVESVIYYPNGRNLELLGVEIVLIIDTYNKEIKENIR